MGSGASWLGETGKDVVDHGILDGRVGFDGVGDVDASTSTNVRPCGAGHVRLRRTAERV